MLDEIDNRLSALRPKLLAVALSLTGNRADAEDLVQDTLTKVWERAETYQGGSFPAWVHAIMKNLHVDDRRSAWRRYRDGNITEEDLEDIAGAGADQEQIYLLQQTLVTLARLGDPCRQILLLCGIGYKTREIAEMVGIPTGTVFSRMFSCRERLFKEMGQPLRGYQ